MTPEEKKTLAQLALLTAHDKCRAMDLIRGLLSAAEAECRKLQGCHSTFEGDPEVEHLCKRILDLRFTVPFYDQDIVQMITGIVGEDYEFVTGNDIWRLRAKDLGIDPDADDWEIDVEWEDPLDVYKRLTAPKAAWIPCKCCGHYHCNIHDMHADECPCPPSDEWTDDPFLTYPKGHHGSV